VINLPTGTSGIFLWKDKNFPLHDGENKYEL